MKENTCKCCIHFRQHYIKYGRSYREAHCGHCVYPRVKRRLPDSEKCTYFELKQKQAANDESCFKP